ncbi:hypothetical protein [Halovenus salina]|uniref:hypothetical protein n=1 Tax=Halovenus salina TaxID=1510225 RepID=UPI002260E786|nr:hypothetical protein [Halovenus salina]
MIDSVSQPEIPETVVYSIRKCRSGRVHRPDPDSDEPQPACRAGEATEAEYEEAPPEDAPDRLYCRYSPCFGGEWL